MTKQAKILWVDLEMTGLDANNDLILEVAAIATDWDFNEIATYEGIIKNEDMTLDERLAANSVFWDANPESKNGLVLQNKDGKELAEIEDELLEFIDEHFEKDAPVLLGGNSIHMDRRFIVSQWPRIDARLHCRMLDVSAWKVVFEGKFKKKFAKPEEHRALGDIRGSIMELKYYLTKLNVKVK
ncbi:MAG TPA: oligoribonuclease [Candidatus Saccharimonadales bacterium]|nr:oligoribonuclease [Candidatus Saccharimonadales bacterium]